MLFVSISLQTFYIQWSPKIIRFERHKLAILYEKSDSSIAVIKKRGVSWKSVQFLLKRF